MQEKGASPTSPDASPIVNPELVGRSDHADKSAGRVLEMMRLIYGNWQTCVTYVFAELGVADLLSSESQSVGRLARATETDPQAMSRFLRCAAALGFVRTATRSDSLEDHHYELTDFGELLSSDHPMSQRAAARLNGAPYRYEPWGKLVEVLRTGSGKGVSPAADDGSVGYLSDKPELLAVFNRAMTNLAVGQNEAMAHSFDFSGFDHVVDIGGGEGGFLGAILQANPGLEGTLLDVDTYENPALPHSVGSRLRRISGDFFVSVPASGDLYLMKNVLHNWPEEQVLRLLTSVKTAMRSRDESARDPRDKRLLVIEHLISDDDSQGVAKWLDLNAMVLVDGAERTLEEYRSIGLKAGFRLIGSTATPAGRYILEFALATQD